MIQNVHCKNGLALEAKLIQIYRVHGKKLFFLQERIMLTDLDNNEIDSIDLIDFISGEAIDYRDRCNWEF